MKPRYFYIVSSENSDITEYFGESIKIWFKIFKNLIVDFLVTFTDRQEIHETKSGYFSDDFKFKLRLYTNRYTYPYFIVEPGKHGGWTYTTPQQFFRIYQPTKELTVITLKKTPTKQHSWIEILLSAALHHFVALFVK